VTSETLEQGAKDALGRNSRKLSTGRTGDRVFGISARGSGILLLAIIAAIALFLIVKSIPSLRADKANFLTSQEWDPDAAQSRFGIAQLAFGTLLSSLMALILATPVAIGISLFIAFYAPRRIAGGLSFVVDLLAAVPSIVYGLWGLQFFVPKMNHVANFLHSDFGWIPLFGGDSVGGQSMLTAAIVLAIMILPIISSISREVFLQVPQPNIEAALALGATKWEVIRMAVLPFGRSGMVSAAMLGLGRALGETIAVALVLSTTSGITFNILKPGGNTFAANIANTFAMAGRTGQSALIASGLVLFIITLLVNMGARAVVARRKEFA
jgi:phosphate transport system permease protein